MVQHREGDKPREPEEHGQRIQGGDGVDVGEAGEEPGSEAEVDEDEDGPDRVEEHEVHLGGGVVDEAGH